MTSANQTPTNSLIAKFNPLLLPLPWLVVLVLVLIYVGMKYTNKNEATATAPTSEKDFPQVFLTDVKVSQFDKNGALHYQMTTPLIRHFQVNEQPSDLDYGIFTTPVFTLVNDPKKQPWIVTAQQGRRENNGVWFTLSTDVLARQTNANNGETTISTQDLRLNTQEQFAETSKAVTMRNAKSQVNALGLRADIKNDQIELLSHVKGTYEP